MTYLKLPISGIDEPQLYARIDDDGLCRLTCTEDYPPFQEWIAAGNTPGDADGPVAVQQL